MDIETFVKRRNDALISLKKDDIVALFNETGAAIPDDETTFWAGVHMARMQVTTFSDEIKAESLGWLHANGYRV
jgi:hypothetical protein